MISNFGGFGVAGLILLILMIIIGIILSSQVLHTQNRGEEGFITRPNPKESYLGKIGIARTNLRPTGTVEIGSERLEAFSEGEFIAQGSEVVVIDVDYGKLTVRER